VITRECGRSSRVSFEAKHCRGRVNEKEPGMTTDMKEMRRLRRLQEVMERRLTQVSAAETTGVMDQPVWEILELGLRQLSQIDIIESL
jgi:hypothetical protein